VKASVPAAISFAVLLYCCWMVHRSRSSYFPPDTTYKVEVTVTGPDGKIIKPIARVPR
jgi:hypothetical protein